MRNKLLIFTIALLMFLFSFLLLIRGQKDISVVENRSLAKFTNFNVSDFLSGEFQDNMETSFADQFIFGQTIKVNFNALKRIINTPIMKIIKSKAKPYDLIPLDNGVYELGNSEYLISSIAKSSKYFESYLDERISQINLLNENNPKVNIYLYKITREKDINIINDIDDYFKNNLNSTINYMSSSYIKNLEDYKEYSYKTDHHWNYKGSYEGYKDIIKLLLNSDKYVKIKDEICYKDIKFVGSRARMVGYLSYYDNFCVYTFDIPKYESKINGVTANYGNPEEYLSGKYSLEKGIGHYARYYGGDDGLVSFKFPSNKNKDNLLIIADSYSNPINKLISSHFYNTYVVDLRNYKKGMGEDFDINNFIKNNDIDKILFMGNVNFYTSNEFKIEN